MASADGWTIASEMESLTSGRQLVLTKGDKSQLCTIFPNHASVVEDGRHSLYIFPSLSSFFSFLRFSGVFF
jgi:hypothetical protein